MFITFEGPEGSGKTTQIKRLAQALTAQGLSVVTTREPGGTAIGDQIRETVHRVDNGGITAVTELLLYSASRAQLVGELIRPALAAGKIVLCDRYADSTLAYQGYGRGLDMQMLQQITQYATGGLKPDLTLYFDIDVENGLARRAQGGDEMNRLDLETVDFHQRVRSGYHALMQAEPGRWLLVDADRPVANVYEDVLALVMKVLCNTQQ